MTSITTKQKTSIGKNEFAKNYPQLSLLYNTDHDKNIMIFWNKIKNIQLFWMAREYVEERYPLDCLDSSLYLDMQCEMISIVDRNTDCVLAIINYRSF